MYPPPRNTGPLSPRDRLVYGIFLVVVLGLFAGEVFTNYQPAKLSALLVVLFWLPLLALHECGHAVTAAVLGWHVGQLVVGMGRLLGSFRIGSALVEIRLFPVEGFVKSVPTNLRWPHLKSALIYFAGPGVELLLAGLIVLIVGPDQLFTRSSDYGLIAWQSLAVAATAQGLLNLIPHSVQTADGDVANDGLGIIRSFMLPESHYAAMIGHTFSPEEKDGQSYDPADWWKRGK